MSLIDDYRNGSRYGTTWLAPSIQHMNNLVGTVSDADLLVQSLATTPDVTLANQYGTANVEITGTGTNKKFKFSYLKGNGIASIAYTSTDASGNRIYTVTMHDGTTYTIQTDKGAKGDTGDTGATGSQGPQGVSITGITGDSGTPVATGTQYTLTITLSNGTTQTATFIAPTGPTGPAGQVASVQYVTTAPTADNTDGGLKIALLSAEPQTRYNGWIYLIEVQ